MFTMLFYEKRTLDYRKSDELILYEKCDFRTRKWYLDNSNLSKSMYILLDDWLQRAKLVRNNMVYTLLLYRKISNPWANENRKVDELLFNSYSDDMTIYRNWLKNIEGNDSYMMLDDWL